MSAQLSKMSMPYDSLVLRWTEEQRERAYKISNDISEDEDHRETRAELRMAVAIYADHACDIQSYYLVQCMNRDARIKELEQKIAELSAALENHDT